MDEWILEEIEGMDLRYVWGKRTWRGSEVLIYTILNHRPVVISKGKPLKAAEELEEWVYEYFRKRKNYTYVNIHVIGAPAYRSVVLHHIQESGLKLKRGRWYRRLGYIVCWKIYNPYL